MNMDNKTQAEPILLYAHPMCPQVGPTRNLLQRSGAPFEYINIYNDLKARITVQEINDGFESVPTLVFPDGSTLTEPSARQLREKLQSMGYKVPATALITGNIWSIAGAALMLLLVLQVLDLI